MDHVSKLKLKHLTKLDLYCYSTIFISTSGCCTRLDARALLCDMVS